MRKILSIILALGLVLALSAIATPVAARITSVAVALDTGTDCAGQIGVYNISFTTSASLTEGLHSVCIKFPAGTVVPATGSPVPWFTGDIVIGGPGHLAGVNVFGSEVTVTGTQVCFLVPVDFDAGALWVYFTTAACIINPADGDYQLEVWTSRAPDNAAMKNAVPYTINPCYSVYDFRWDSSLTYPGMKKGFVPPFKACGQNTTGTNMTGGVWDPTVGAAGGFMNAFNLTFRAYPAGCFAPCTNVSFYVSLTASPQFPCFTKVAKVALNLTGPTGPWSRRT